MDGKMISGISCVIVIILSYKLGLTCFLPTAFAYGDSKARGGGGGGGRGINLLLTNACISKCKDVSIGKVGGMKNLHGLKMP